MSPSKPFKSKSSHPQTKMPRSATIDNEMYFDDARRCTAKGVFAVEQADYENVVFGKAPAKPKPQGTRAAAQNT